MSKKILIVGAGFSGAVLARELAEHGGLQCLIIDSRDHLAGNSHTARGSHGVMEHVYGPHIFNTNHADVVGYIHRWGKWHPHVNRVKAVTPRGVFSFPINLHTINQFFGKAFSPSEARGFISSLGETSIVEPTNFEEQALKLVGRELYENFFRGYTTKQWGIDPRALPASILKRLPIRFDYNDNYYNSAWQFLPEAGYTAVVERILDHPLVSVELGRKWDPAMAGSFDHVFFSGAIDEYFGCLRGRLGYRTIFFEKIVGLGDLQGNAVLNYTDEKVPYTRQHEHKYFSPWEKHEKSVVFREFSQATQDGDTPFYPLRLEADRALLAHYVNLAHRTERVTFIGRLGTYRYLDMDQVIGEALDTAAAWLKARRNGTPRPVFSVERTK